MSKQEKNTKRSVVAKDLGTSKYRQRIVKSKRIYSRKRKINYI